MQWLHHVTEEGCKIGAVSSPFCEDLCHIEWCVRVGRNQEIGDCKQWEMAHLLEHVLGGLTSSSYPNSEELFERMEQQALQFNASVNDIQTQYWIRGPRHLASQMLDVLLCAWTDFCLPDQDFVNKEIDAVFSELAQDLDQEWRLLQDQIRFLQLGAIPTLQAIDHLSSCSRQEIAFNMWEFKRKWYTPDRSCLLLIGKDMEFLWRESITRLEKWSLLYKHLPKRPCLVPTSTITTTCIPCPFLYSEKKFPSQPKVILVPTPYVGQCKIVMSISGSLVTSVDPARRLFYAIAMVLGQGVTSRLLVRLRIDLALVYDVIAFVSLHPYDAALSTFYIETTLETQNVILAIKVIQTELEKIAQGGFTEREIQRWHNQCRLRESQRHVQKGDLSMLRKRWSKWLYWGWTPDNSLPVIHSTALWACRKLFLSPEAQQLIAIGGTRENLSKI